MHDGAANHGDVYVGSMAAPVQRVPGSRTPNGKKAVSRIVDDALARIRRRLRTGPTDAP